MYIFLGFKLESKLIKKGSFFLKFFSLKKKGKEMRKM